MPRQTVLIIEDNEVMSNLLSDLFRQKKYQTLQAYDGQEGIELLKKHPTAICLDMYMPTMTGIEFLKQYEQLQGKKIPIFILTVSGSFKAEAKRISSSIVYYFDKSNLDVSEIVSRIDTFLQNNDLTNGKS